MAPVPAAVNLIDRLRGTFETNAILTASAYVCEDPYKTQRALEGIVPATLLAIAHRYTPAGLLALLVNRSSQASPEAIFGEDSMKMAEIIASDAGIQQESARSLVELAAPRIVEALRQLQSERNLGPEALVTILGAHRERLTRLMPGEVAQRFRGWF